MATNLGKVGIVAKGTWSNTTAYEVLDAVTGPDGLYVAKQEVPAGTALSNTTYWQPALTTSNFPNIASFGIAGNTTITLPAKSGQIIVIGRSTTSTKGMFFIDNQLKVIDMISSSAVYSVTVTDNTLSIQNTAGVTSQITVISRFSTTVPTT